MASTPEKLSTSVSHADQSRKDDLRAEGIEKLSSPGVDSNWMDWSFLMETCISASIYGYVMRLTPVPPPSHYDTDCAKICALLVCYVSQPNLRILQRHRGDPRGMWGALKAAHESNTAGTRMMWLEKLVAFKLESEDVLAELDRLEGIAERLTSLITPSRPLSVDEILTMVISISLPDSYKPTLVPLLQREAVSSVQVLAAVREDVTRRAISSNTDKVVDVVAMANDRDEGKGGMNREKKTCTHCRKSGHDIESCWSKPKKGKKATPSTNDKYDELKAELDKLKLKMRKSRTHEKASVAKDGTDDTTLSMSEKEDSDFSYQVVTANLGKITGMGDVVDSGCSKHMRPTSENMTNIVKDQTVVNLADGTSIESTSRGLFNPGFIDSSKHSAILIPSLTEPLLSVSSLADTGIVSVFDKDKCMFFRSPTITGTVLGHASRRGGLYYSSNVRVKSHVTEKCNIANNDLMLWHRRFNHTNVQTLRRKLRIAGWMWRVYLNVKCGSVVYAYKERCAVVICRAGMGIGQRKLLESFTQMYLNMGLLGEMAQNTLFSSLMTTQNSSGAMRSKTSPMY